MPESTIESTILLQKRAGRIDIFFIRHNYLLPHTFIKEECLLQAANFALAC
jgi:hypothetical protein